MNLNVLPRIEDRRWSTWAAMISGDPMMIDNAPAPRTARILRSGRCIADALAVDTHLEPAGDHRRRRVGPSTTMAARAYSGIWSSPWMSSGWYVESTLQLLSRPM